MKEFEELVSAFLIFYGEESVEVDVFLYFDATYAEYEGWQLGSGGEFYDDPIPLGELINSLCGSYQNCCK